MPTLRSALSLITLLLAPAGALAQGYVIDQQNTGETDGAYSVSGLAPLGQEFLPARRALDVVVLQLNNFTGPPLPAQLTVRVRAQSIAGDLLGTSSPVELPYLASGEVRFDFDPAVALTPGSPHVLELVQAPGGGNAMVSAMDFNHYAAGRMVYRGELVEALDLWFQTGVDPALPAASGSWGELKQRWGASPTLESTSGGRRQWAPRLNPRGSSAKDSGGCTAPVRQ